MLSQFKIVCVEQIEQVLENALTRMPERLRAHLRIQAVALVVVGALTQAEYPWGAFGVMAIPLGSGPETAVLVLRNLALVLLTGHAVWLAVQASRRASSTDRDDIG